MFKNKKLKLFLFGIGLFFIFLVGVKTGQILLAGAFTPPFLNATSSPDVSTTSNTDVIQGDFSLFWNVLGIVKERYYDPSLFNDQKMIYGAINGALSTLDDPYTVFFDPEDSKKFNEDLAGKFGGIGAEIGMKNNRIVIVTPLKNSPAERAGLKPGDIIVKVDDTYTLNMTVDKAVKIIRGEPGTYVKLEILREDWTSPQTFTIQRELINIPTLDWKFLGTSNDRIAYIQLYNFYAQAPVEFYKAALNILVQNPKGLVLDLRNNPGGYLEVAQNLAGWFLKRGDVFVIEKGRGEKLEKLYVAGNEAFLRIPVVVLVNEGTASAAEILAGALRDQRGIKLIGEKTFGKGSVQELVNLPNGATVKITIAEWLTPNGFSINKVGLNPDIEVKLTEEDRKEQKDPQLDTALQILRSQMR